MEETSLSFKVSVLHNMHNNQSRIKCKHQQKNPRLWLGFFHSCLESLVYLTHGSLTQILHRGLLASSVASSSNDKPGVSQELCASLQGPCLLLPLLLLPPLPFPRELHTWLLEHLLSTIEMQHLTFVWARYLLRNSPWECENVT